MRDNISAAVACYSNGLVFRKSADILARETETDESGKPKSPLLSIPYYVLVSHAAELFLKAALLKRGFEEAELSKFAYGHDLLALLKEVEGKGIVLSDKTIGTLTGLHHQHKEHTLRYMKFMGDTKLVYFPPFADVSGMLDELFIYTRLNN